MPRRLRPVLARALVVAAALASLASCTSSDSTPDAKPSDKGTPLEKFETLRLALAREPFCDDVSPEAIDRALGGAQEGGAAYTDGQRGKLTGTVKDIAHESSCSFFRGGTVARAWIFSPPITPSRAKDLIKASEKSPGCEIVEAPKFGRPSTTTQCVESGRVQLSFRGLFGDAWLSCSLTVPAAERDERLLDRAGRWCVEVAKAAAD
jgi:hypothetical protein